jgi:predicted TPR repeat methyltransferase
MNTKTTYNEFADKYHEKRNTEENSLYNDYLDYPMISYLLGSNLKNSKMADLGCGSGIFTSRLKELGADIVGVDNSLGLIEIAKTTYPNIPFSLAEVTQTNLSSGEYDLVVSSLVMHYLKDLTPFFKEVKRILKKNGCFIFSFHHPVNEIMKKVEKDIVLGPYFHEDSYTWNMLEGMELKSFHHTFENIICSLFNAGFVVEELKEARPEGNLASKYPDFFQLNSQYPSFAGIRARSL